MIGLGLICIVSVGALAWMYMGMQSRDAQILALSNQVANQQNWLSSNMTYIGNLTSQIGKLNTQVSGLSSNNSILKVENTALRTPKLLTINLLSTDVRSTPGSPYLHIVGVVSNVGTDSAKNCKLYVLAYHGVTKVIDTYVTLGSGTIAGEYYVNVDTSVLYSGSALETWSVDTQWTS
jgi:hypothetical protein